jgi:hypothetical protein
MPDIGTTISQVTPRDEDLARENFPVSGAMVAPSANYHAERPEQKRH